MSDRKEIWKKRVASWRASGKTAEKYSAGRGWSAGTLLWWSSRLGREAAPPVVRIAQLVRSPAPHSSGQPVGMITRARLDRKELDREIGWLTVPELPLPTMLPSDASDAPLSPAP